MRLPFDQKTSDCRNVQVHSPAHGIWRPVFLPSKKILASRSMNLYLVLQQRIVLRSLTETEELYTSSTYLALQCVLPATTLSPDCVCPSAVKEAAP